MRRLDGERIGWEAIDGPLTDYEYSDLSDAGGSPPRRRDLGERLRAARLASKRPLPPIPPHDRTRKQNKNRRFAERKKVFQAKTRALGEQKSVAKKRGLEAAMGVTLKLPLDMGSCAGVTGPGWVAKPLPSLPRTPYTISRLEKKFKIVRFNWDGVYVSALLFCMSTQKDIEHLICCLM